MRSIQPFNHKTALLISIFTSLIHTGIMVVGNLYNVKENGFVIEFHPVLDFFLTLVLFYILFIFCFHIIQKRITETKKYAWTIAGAILITAIYTFGEQALREWIFSDPSMELHFIIGVVNDCLVALLTLLITFMLYWLTRRQQIRLENQQLAAENMQIRYEALEMQLDPHFLFNSLNTLNGLIGTDDEKAHQYVQQLASTYRYITRNRKIVPLRSELEFADSYIYLMQIRYGNNIVITKELTDDIERWYILPISIQLLLENAIKHNVVSDKYPMNILIKMTSAHTILVENQIHHKVEATTGEGRGLLNLSQRYELLFDKQVAINENQDKFSVEIPLIDEDEAQKFLNEVQ